MSTEGEKKIKKTSKQSIKTKLIRKSSRSADSPPLFLRRFTPFMSLPADLRSSITRIAASSRRLVSAHEP
jgi:hypothetical protein